MSAEESDPLDFEPSGAEVQQRLALAATDLETGLSVGDDEVPVKVSLERRGLEPGIGEP